MADKEFLLGNRARELLKYTKQATRVVSGDISKADVRAIITRVAELDDICDVKMVCQEVVHVLDTKDKEGFTKSTFRMYGEDMRETAKKILTDIHRANNTNFVVAYEDRIHKIEEVVDGCSLLFCVSKWGWGFDKYVAEANKGKGLKFAKWLKPYFQFILPALIVVIFLQGLL